MKPPSAQEKQEGGNPEQYRAVVQDLQLAHVQLQDLTQVLPADAEMDGAWPSLEATVPSPCRVLEGHFQVSEVGFTFPPT